jgi:hypothetical protein
MALEPVPGPSTDGDVDVFEMEVTSTTKLSWVAHLI